MKILCIEPVNGRNIRYVNLDQVVLIEGNETGKRTTLHLSNGLIVDIEINPTKFIHKYDINEKPTKK